MWKYVLSLALNDAGFDFSVLSEFRQRLVEHEASERLLDEMLQQCKAKGLLKTRGKQRTDSTHILAAIRNLNQLELVHETLRHTLNELALAAPAWLKSWVPSEWFDRYSERTSNYRLPKAETERQQWADMVGQDGLELLMHVYQTEASCWLAQLPAIEILRQVWVQNYYQDNGVVHLREPKDQPPSAQRITSPYDLDARYSSKRDTIWVGYKVHLTETCELDTPNLITAASYGESELRIGPWMPEYRDQFFLATKTDKRTYDEAKTEFERSLERSQVDSVDLIQLHYLVGEEEWEIAMGSGGVLEYLQEARDQGLVKYIGVTGHDVVITRMHLKSLERFDFDSVLLPFNYLMMQNETCAAGVRDMLQLAKERNFAVQTLKSICRRPYPGDRTHATWYQPLTDQASIDKAVHWVLGQEGIFLNTVGDIGVLPMVLDAASRFEARPSNEEMQSIVSDWDMASLFT